MTTLLSRTGRPAHMRSHAGPTHSRPREWVRLLNADWRNLRFTLGVAETLTDPRFTEWLSANTPSYALEAARNFDSQTAEARQMLTMLVRCFRLGHRVPRWVQEYRFAGSA